MSLKDQLLARSEGKCELCGSANGLVVYEVPPQNSSTADNSMMICGKCLAQVEKKEDANMAHWTILSTSMWSEVPAVQVVSWRMLNRFKNETWAADNLDMLYLDDDTLDWAKASGDHESEDATDLHRDSNGNVLQNGDSVKLIKSLDVKGSTLNAKMGTAVKNIRLVADNTEQIEGKIDGQLLVILTKYVRKA